MGNVAAETQPTGYRWTGFSFREYLEMLKQRRSFDGGGSLEDYA